MPTNREVKYRMKIFGSVKSPWLYRIFSGAVITNIFKSRKQTYPLDLYTVFAGRGSVL